MKYISWSIVGVMALIVVNEFSYLGQTSLALVLIVMAFAIGILALMQSFRDK